MLMEKRHRFGSTSSVQHVQTQCSTRRLGDESIATTSPIRLDVDGEIRGAKMLGAIAANGSGTTRSALVKTDGGFAQQQS